MKILTFSLFFFTLTFNAQIRYEKGYIIDNDDQKIECYIKNVDWNSSPDNIQYRFDLKSEIQKGDINDIKEFYIYNTEHFYKRFDVELDINAVSDQETRQRELQFNNSLEFLRVLVDGKANLYEFPEGDIFLFDIDDQDIRQLEYKKYLTQEMIRKENNAFQKQLFDYLKCDLFSMEKFMKLVYNRSELIDLFIEYNECKNVDPVIYNSKKTPVVVNFNLTLGANSTSLQSDYTLNSSFSASENFDNQLIVVPGINVEVLLPANKNKWAVFAGLTYQYYTKSEAVVDFFDIVLGEVSFEYSYLEVPFGAKHYMYLNSDLKLFLSAAYAPILHIGSNDTDNFNRTATVQGDIDFDKKEESNRAIITGLGVNFRNKYSIEINYYISKKVNSNNNFVNNMDGSLSLIASYTLF